MNEKYQPHPPEKLSPDAICRTGPTDNFKGGCDLRSARIPDFGLIFMTPIRAVLNNPGGCFRLKSWWSGKGRRLTPSFSPIILLQILLSNEGRWGIWGLKKGCLLASSWTINWTPPLGESAGLDSDSNQILSWTGTTNIHISSTPKIPRNSYTLFLQSPQKKTGTNLAIGGKPQKRTTHHRSTVKRSVTTVTPPFLHLVILNPLNPSTLASDDDPSKTPVRPLTLRAKSQ